jgi:hypothetical protein
VELHRCPALEEEDVPVIPQPEEVAEVLARALIDGVIGGGAVADLHDGGAHAVIDREFVAHLLHHFLGEGSGAGGEVVLPPCGGGLGGGCVGDGLHVRSI